MRMREKVIYVAEIGASERAAALRTHNVSARGARKSERETANEVRSGFCVDFCG
jgi:hypothetical protein